MEYVIAAAVVLLMLYFSKIISYRSKSIHCAIEALKQTVNTLPDESIPSPRVIKSKLAMKYYDLSHRADNNDIRDYAKKMLGISNPKPEHIAMLLLISLSNDFKLEQSTTNLSAYADIARWCEQAERHLVDKERSSGLDT